MEPGRAYCAGVGSVTITLSSPAEVQTVLEQIEKDLAMRQNIYEAAARRWFGAKREIERAKAVALLTAEGNTTVRRSAGIAAAYDVDGAESEAEYEALKAAIGVLEARAMICMSILKAQGRA